MASSITKLGLASLAALVGVVAFIAFSPKNESSAHSVSTPPELRGEAPQKEITADAKNGTAQPDTQSLDLHSVHLPATNASEPDITLDLDVIGNDQKPILNVKTNLPPKTILMANLANPINQGGDGYFGQAKGAVADNQIVQFGPFSKTGDNLSPGTYLLTVSTVVADLQPKEVQAFFGVHGEGLMGRQVLTLPGTLERLVLQKFQFKINPDGSIDNLPHPSGDD